MVSGTRGRSVRRLLQQSTMLLVLCAIIWPLFSASVGAQTGTWSAPRTVYFQQTGQSLDQLFLDVWRSGGGAQAYGYPITPEMTDANGRIVQYLHYARFEYWPEGGAEGAHVQFGAVGYDLKPETVPATSSTRSDRSTRNDGTTDDATILKAWEALAKKHATRPTTDTWRYVPETKHSVQHGFKTFWEATGEAAYLGNPLTEEYALNGVTYQVFERGQLAWKAGGDPWMVAIGEVIAKAKRLEMSPQPQGNLPTYDEALFIPPSPSTGGISDAPPSPGLPKAIVISISRQMLWAYEYDTVVNSTFVSTGRPGFDTPTGTFSIVVKKEVEDMSGLLGGEFYDIKNVPDVMYFTGVGHAIHGTFWHNNFGQVMSHGCVNLPLDVADWLFNWTPMGTTVVIIP